MAGQCGARRGKARLGKARQAWCGKARQGEAGYGKARQARIIRKDDFMVYSWKENARIKTDANIAAAMCQELENSGKGLSAQTLLEANVPEDAPLHNEFEWDDTTAANEYRLSQARHIIGSLVVVAENVEPVKMYFNISRAKSDYTSITTIMQSTDTREKLFETAMKELKAFQRKYSSIEKFEKVFAAINELVA